MYNLNETDINNEEGLFKFEGYEIIGNCEPQRGAKTRSSSGCLFLEPYKRCVLFACAGVMPVRRLKHEKPLVY